MCDTQARLGYSLIGREILSIVKPFIVQESEVYVVRVSYQDNSIIIRVSVVDRSLRAW